MMHRHHSLLGLPALLIAGVLGAPAVGQMYEETIIAPPLTIDTGDEFGLAVDLAGNRLAVGAPLNDDLSNNGGLVHLLDVTNPHRPVVLHTWSNPDVDDPDPYFGQTLSLDASRLLVGTQSATGGYALFDTESGALLSRITPDLLPDDAIFWRGNVCLAESSAYLPGRISPCCFVVFQFDVSDPAHPSLARVFQLDDDSASPGFGYRTAVTSDLIAIGDYQYERDDSEQGAVFLFDRSTGTHLSSIFGDDVNESRWFGLDVRISGTVLAIGAPLDRTAGSVSGAVYLYDISDPTTPAFRSELLVPTAPNLDWFGLTIALDSQRLVVSSPASSESETQTGVVFDYDVTDPRHPRLLVTYRGSDAQHGDQFGFATAVDSHRLFVGNRYNDFAGQDAGGVYFYDRMDICAQDLDASGAVDFRDLLSILDDWGLCFTCPTDLDRSKRVDALDLLLVLANWGACPELP